MNTSFSPQNPYLQIAWDSTSLGLLKECPRKYYYSVVQGYMGSGGNVHLVFGILIHSALEFYDKERAAGASFDEAYSATLKYALEISKDFSSDDPNKNRETYIRTVAWYMDQYKDDTFETITLANGKAAVELSFRFQIDLTAPSGVPYLLCGHLDKLGRFGDTIYFGDRKTTKSTITSDFFKKFSPDNQMSLYSLAGKVVYNLPISGGIIDGIQVAVNFSRYERGFVTRTNEQLEEWLQGTKTFIRQNEAFAQHAMNLKEIGHPIEKAFPMNDKSCQNYGGCPFRDICNKSASVRDAFLKTHFEQRTWDPLLPR